MAGRRGPRLQTTTDVSVFLAKVVREIYRGDLDPAIAGKIGFLCNSLRKCLEVADLERRLEVVEAQMRSPENETPPTQSK